jgi:hypothetical protein
LARVNTLKNDIHVFKYLNKYDKLLQLGKNLCMVASFCCHDIEDADVVLGAGNVHQQYSSHQKEKMHA